jgi:hypothetical protein
MGILQNAVISVQVVVSNVKDSLKSHFLHFSEQYFTFSQSFAHFFRHSKGKPQVTQSFGSKPFLRLAIRGITKDYLTALEEPQRL